MQGFFERRSDYPRPNGPVLSSTQLRPADVLLSRGEGNISDAIVAADGGSYSHAALWSGGGVVEAREDGVHERSLNGERDVYRFFRDSTPLEPEVAQGVVAIARAKVGNSYAFQELYLLGALFAVGARPERPVLRRALDLLGGVRADRLERWLLDLGSAREPLVCTELVAKAFYEAHMDRSHALEILPRHLRPALPEVRASAGIPRWEDVEALEELQEACRNLLGSLLLVSEGARGEARESLASPRKVLLGSIAVQAGSRNRLGTVTPADLQFSPSLRFVGRVRPS